MIRNIRRSIRHWCQRRTRGFDDTVTWSLDHSLAKLIAPRLRRFRDVCRDASFAGVPGSYCELDEHGYPTASPVARERWHADLDKMVTAFEWAASDMWVSTDLEKEKLAHEGIKALRGAFL